MQHREPVEPVVEALLADLEERRAVAEQHPLQPGRHSAVDRHVGQADLVGQRSEALQVPGRPWAGRLGGEGGQRPGAGGERHSGAESVAEQPPPGDSHGGNPIRHTALRLQALGAAFLKYSAATADWIV